MMPGNVGRICKQDFIPGPGCLLFIGHRPVIEAIGFYQDIFVIKTVGRITGAVKQGPTRQQAGFGMIGIAGS